MAALPEEARGILKTGRWRKTELPGSQPMYERRVGNGEAVLAISGVGKVRAEAATRAVLEERRPSAVISLGFAGGLAAGQRAGDMVVANVLIPAEGVLNGGQKPRFGEALHTDRALTDEALDVLATSGLRYRAGACVTASEIVSRPDAKARLRLDADALAVEMESFWIGSVCREWETPFLAARAIVDTAERPLPDFIARSELDAGAGSGRRALFAAILRPNSFPALIRLGGAASKARNSLAAFASGFMGAWSGGSGE